ncbi:MAG: hydrolase [Marmoricola sp.]|nr:hydrolase [Marmoricola sp.]
MPSRTVAALLALFAVFIPGSTPSVATPTAAPVMRASSVRSLVWSDEFTGPAGASTSSAKWTFAIGGGGWGNNELQCYTSSRANASTNGQGQLVISALRTPGHLCADGHRNAFTSARITTQKSFTVTHGRLEIRAKLPAGAGSWPAFWALGADQPQVGWPRCGEIDVMEHTGNRPYVTTSAAHLASYLGAHWYTTRISPSSTTLSSRFHVYAVDWTSNSLTFYRDSVVTGVITRAQVTRHGTWPFDKPFYLLLNLAMGGTYAGPVPAGVTSPQRYVIDYVRVYH